jgi:hypothetical protein
LIEQRRAELSLVLIDLPLDTQDPAAFQTRVKSVNSSIRMVCIRDRTSVVSNQTDMTTLDKPFSALDLLKSVQSALRG